MAIFGMEMQTPLTEADSYHISLMVASNILSLEGGNLIARSLFVLFYFPLSSFLLFSFILISKFTSHHIIIQRLYFLSMQKFLTYKSKIVKSKRDSQKIEQQDLLQIIRQYQQLKTIKKQKKKKTSPDSFLFKPVQYPKYDEQLLQRQGKCQQIYIGQIEGHPQDHLFIEKQQSTLSSLCSHESSDSLNENEYADLARLPDTDLQFLHSQPLFANRNEKMLTNSILSEVKMNVQHQKIGRCAIRQNLLTAKQNLGLLSNSDKEVIKFYEQSQSKQNYFLTKNSNNFQPLFTSRQPLQLSQLHLSKSKLKERILFCEDIGHNILEEDENKVEMLFREEYKDIFLSSISNIQFNEGNNSNNSSNSFKNELDGSQGSLFNDSLPNENKFQRILDIINQKDNKDNTKSQKQTSNNCVIPQKRRQKVMILNPKEPVNNKPSEVPKNPKTAKTVKNEKKHPPRK